MTKTDLLNRRKPLYRSSQLRGLFNYFQALKSLIYFLMSNVRIPKDMWPIEGFSSIYISTDEINHFLWKCSHGIPDKDDVPFVGLENAKKAVWIGFCEPSILIIFAGLCRALRDNNPKAVKFLAPCGIYSDYQSPSLSFTKILKFILNEVRLQAGKFIYDRLCTHRAGKRYTNLMKELSLTPPLQKEDDNVSFPGFPGGWTYQKISERFNQTSLRFDQTTA